METAETKRRASAAALWAAVLLVWLVASVSGAWYVRDRFLNRPVTVTVVNATHNVVAVRLNHEGGSIAVGSLPPSAQRTVRFRPGGESSYSLSVVLPGAKRKAVTGGGGYVDRGYRTRETITGRGIRTDYLFP